MDTKQIPESICCLYQIREQLDTYEFFYNPKIQIGQTTTQSYHSLMNNTQGVSSNAGTGRKLSDNVDSPPSKKILRHKSKPTINLTQSQEFSFSSTEINKNQEKSSPQTFNTKAFLPDPQSLSLNQLSPKCQYLYKKIRKSSFASTAGSSDTLSPPYSKNKKRAQQSSSAKTTPKMQGIPQNPLLSLISLAFSIKSDNKQENSGNTTNLRNLQQDIKELQINKPTVLQKKPIKEQEEKNSTLPHELPLQKELPNNFEELAKQISSFQNQPSPLMIKDQKQQINGGFFQQKKLFSPGSPQSPFHQAQISSPYSVQSVFMEKLKQKCYEQVQSQLIISRRNSQQIQNTQKKYFSQIKQQNQITSKKNAHTMPGQMQKQMFQYSNTIGGKPFFLQNSNPQIHHTPNISCFQSQPLPQLQYQQPAFQFPSVNQNINSIEANQMTQNLKNNQEQCSYEQQMSQPFSFLMNHPSNIQSDFKQNEDFDLNLMDVQAERESNFNRQNQEATQSILFFQEPIKEQQMDQEDPFGNQFNLDGYIQFDQRDQENEDKIYDVIGDIQEYSEQQIQLNNKENPQSHSFREEIADELNFDKNADASFNHDPSHILPHLNRSNQSSLEKQML